MFLSALFHNQNNSNNKIKILIVNDEFQLIYEIFYFFSKLHKL